MSSPGPQDSPPPGVDWAQLASNVDEFLTTRNRLIGIPHEWLKCVEAEVNRAQSRGRPLQHPIAYRFEALLGGVVRLQEAKYIADLYENGLRYALSQHVQAHPIEAEKLFGKKPLERILRDVPTRVLDNPTLMADEVVMGCSLFQVTEAIAQNWRWIGTLPKRRPGFRALFWKTVALRDVNMFQRDAKRVRQLRNVIAHSKGLPTAEQVLRLHKTATMWLKPLGVEVEKNIAAYRKRRPGFLDVLSGQ